MSVKNRKILEYIKENMQTGLYFNRSKGVSDSAYIPSSVDHWFTKPVPVLYCTLSLMLRNPLLYPSMYEYILSCRKVRVKAIKGGQVVIRPGDPIVYHKHDKRRYTNLKHVMKTSKWEI